MASHPRIDVRPRLPRSIVSRIISYLGPESLARAAAVSHQFRELAYSEDLWKTLINSYLPEPIETCKSAPSFRRLYIAFHPYWFIPKFRFWLSDEEHNGQLVFAQFNTNLLCIEAWPVVGYREHSEKPSSNIDAEVTIRRPDVRVHVDEHQLIFRFGVRDGEWDGNEDHAGSRHARAAVMYDEDAAASGSQMELSLGCTWPEAPIGGDLRMWPTPEMSTEASVPKLSAGANVPASYRPPSSPTTGQPTFRLHEKVGYHSHRSDSGTRSSRTDSERHNIHKTITFGTLSLDVCAPSVEKPWQGIWCGDYFGHGMEF